MKIRLLSATALASVALATPAFAQDVPPNDGSSDLSRPGDTNTGSVPSDIPSATVPGPRGDTADATADTLGEGIVITAQRQNQRLQDVPIAVSAFSGEALEAQQIKNPLDLQLTLPNIQLTKTNFTASSSLTIRGIGDLCVGVTCDAATGINLNDEPLFASPFFQTEFYDVERIEVLRGPQGTLFGRNATAGVVNTVTAKPDLDAISAGVEGEYGNYDSKKVKGFFNLPIGDRIGVRVAGLYLKRDGYTRNIFNGAKVDDRDLYSIRGTLRIKPTDTTTLDIIGSYFREKDSRLRIQKNLCTRDPTGVLGCLPDGLGFGQVNTNAVFAPGNVPSREFLGIALGNPALGQAFGLGSIYGPDAGAGSNPADFRTINSDYPVSYFNDELIIQGKLSQQLGDRFNLSLSGTYQDNSVDSSEDYLFGLSNRAVAQPGINTLAAAAAGLIPGLPAAFFAPVAAALIPNGPGGQLCTSNAEETGLGAFGGFKQCYDTPRDFDRSRQTTRAYSVEGIVSSDLDGPFNFLLGGIYSNQHVPNNDYFVNSFYIDYTSGVLGAFQALGRNAAGQPTPPSFLATPYFRNNTADYRLKSYGIFGEGYLELGRLKFTAGLRYNNDRKAVRARSSLLTTNFLVPFGSPTAYDSPFFGTVDFDPGVAGNQAFQIRQVKFGEFTGRAVVDYQITPDNLLYASYSRGYKSGGINPPLSDTFQVSDTFRPEFIDAFEVGSKNSFGNGQLVLNATAFYYKYKDLQLSRIIARTAVNDNVNADVYGVEAEAIVRPIRAVTVNLGASYLHTKVADDKLLSNPRDPSGGRTDAVIIKDLSNGSNCTVSSNVGSAAAAQGFVTAVNRALGLRGPTPFPGSNLAATGAFGICSALAAQAANPAVGGAFGGITLDPSGVPVNIRGNELPQAPKYKFSGGVQYAADLGNFTLTPRFDAAYTGEFQASIFNTRIVDKVAGYVVLNAQLQLDGPDKRFFVRGFIQNITDNNAITGQYVGDASSGLYTNAFLLEPRRYGVAAGVRF